jgi:hypothetical protein
MALDFVFVHGSTRGARAAVAWAEGGGEVFAIGR